MVGTVRYRTTHAITIDAPREVVWSWLIQLGQGRGGMYSYDWLENLLGLYMHSAQAIRPELQRLAVGDVVSMVPEGTQPSLQLVIARLDAPALLVLGPTASREDAFAANLPYPCWTFRLTRTARGGTRLLDRFQSDFRPSPLGWLMNKYALEPVHFLMERKMLLTLKERSERPGPLTSPV